MTKKRLNLKVNSEIAFTYLVSRKKQTLIASLGVMFGISMYVFMNSLISGTNEYFEKMTLSSTPHIRLYRDQEKSNNRMLNSYIGDSTINLISNPKMVNNDDRIDNPNELVRFLKSQPAIVAASPQITANVICTNGNIQGNGVVSGINIMEQDKMCEISMLIQTELLSVR
jgi:lipoprotein-releasing system permease protein